MRIRRAITRLASLSLVFACPSWGQQPRTKPPSSEKRRNAATGPANKQPQPRVILDLSGFELTNKEKLQEQSVVVAATRGFGGQNALPRLLAPQLGKVYSVNPVFRWSYHGKAGTCFFILSNETHAELFRAEVGSSPYRYPELAPALAPGKTYYWSIEVRFLGEASRQSESSGFVVVAGEERQKLDTALSSIVEKDPYRSALARARLLEDSRAWYDVVTVYTELIGRYPKRAALYEGRGVVYSQLEITKPLATQDFLKADELNDSKKEQH